MGAKYTALFPKKSDQVNIFVHLKEATNVRFPPRVVSALPWEQSRGPVYKPEQETFIQFWPSPFPTVSAHDMPLQWDFPQ